MPGSANVISGNSLAGIDFGDRAVDNALQGNKIGVALDGVSPLGNADDGVEFGDPFGGDAPDNGNVVGGTTPGTGNTIAFNDDGVGTGAEESSWVTPSSRTALQGSRSLARRHRHSLRSP